MKLITFLAHWLGRQFLSLLMIIAVLLIGSFLYSAIQNHLGLLQEREDRRTAQETLANTWVQVASDTEKRVKAVNTQSQAALDQRIQAIKGEIAQQETVRRPVIERKLALLRGDTQDIEREVRIDLLKQELQHLELAKAVLDRVTAIAQAEYEQERRRKRHSLIYGQLQAVSFQVEALKNAHPILINIPVTQARQNLQFLESQEADLGRQNQQAHTTYQQQKDLLDRLKKLPTTLPRFVLSKRTVTDIEDELQKSIREKTDEIGRTWISVVIMPTLKVLPTALLILLATILSPVAIKALFYYLIAPLAARCSPVRLRPDSSGIVHAANGVDGSGAKVSGKSLAIALGANEELLVHPEYLRGMETDSIKSTQWLLNKRYPLTSLASGLYLLTRLRADHQHSHVISAKEDILAEVALIEIPAGTKVVLQPRSLIGVIQSAEQPLQIESQWRLGSLSAWLTLQLRYLVFSGPAKLLVTGCQGVRIDPVGTGQTINQAATIGFSSNLAYSVTRCEPFVAYLRGKQELFNDHFAGASGYYLSEETPNAGKKSGLAGKGLEGLADSVLKVFGI
ncbi:MAG: hypothetical protein CVU18_06955 [Betaproteobacteria bacterium HGW-Betaproteobacteria-12]|nr:MAG: hypothetical protein CVU18_06955 [Betaproteobacteria bacterium HGW-Betaproteobacteria-12]